MKAGKLDTLITIQTSTDTVRNDGVVISVWTDLAKVRAEIVESGTEQFYRVYGSVDEATTLFRIRYFDGLTTSHRIVMDGVNFDIREITEIRRKRGHEVKGVAI